MPIEKNSYDDAKYVPKQGVTTYICSYCKISRHDKCANRSQVLKGICGCVYYDCLAARRAEKEKKEKENATKS